MKDIDFPNFQSNTASSEQRKKIIPVTSASVARVVTLRCVRWQEARKQVGCLGCLAMLEVHREQAAGALEDLTCS